MLTEVQIKQFEEDGFLVVRNFFNSQHTEKLITAWQSVKQELQFNTGRYQRSSRFVGGKLPYVLDKSYEHEDLVRTASQLLNEPNIAVFLRNFLLKDESWGGAVQTHQDMPYLSGALQKLIAFVPLQFINEENGGLKIFRRTHMYGNIGIRGTIHPEQCSENDVVCPSIDVGDVMFMNVLTWHYSEPTKVAKPRPMLQIIYQSASDGSYSGLEQPTLVAGEWQTTHFLPYGKAITPDLTSIQTVYEQETLAQKTEIQRLQTVLEEKQLELDRNQTELHNQQSQLQALQIEIQAMKSSKFWQLRSRWFRFKSFLGYQVD